MPVKNEKDPVAHVGLVEEAIAEHWGDRCPEHETGCPCCDAWAEFDALAAPDLSKRVAELEEELSEAAQWHENEADRLKANRRLGIKNYRAGFWINKHLARAAVIRSCSGGAVGDRIRGLEEALRPFAEESRRFDAAAVHFGVAAAPGEYRPGCNFTHEQLRRARSALQLKPRDEAQGEG